MRTPLTFAFPGRLDLNTGGYAYDRQLITGLSALGWAVEPLSLGEGFPAPDAAQRQGAEERLSALPDGRLVVIDGLAFGVLPDWAAREAGRLAIVALVHHPLALETGLSEAAQAVLRQSEIRALSHARHVIVTSPMTARELVAHYDVPEARITVALPGTEPGPLAAGGNVPPHIVSVGTLTKRKGHDTLLRALSAIADLDWRASIAGSRDLDPDTAQALAALCDELGLSDRVTFLGDRPDARALMASGDLFALASRYEGYGMVFAEALSQGLPVVACHAGAVPDVVPDGAGLLVAPDDPAAFAAALRRLLSSPQERRKFAEASRAAGLNLPGWQDTAAIVSRSLSGLLADLAKGVS
ncbi:Glycosyltransferase involved in cell wall bisynthesis [Rhizobium sp. RU35A]|uniref:Glycosyltransferase family 4 protein n=1 Tax=Rhizobium straminoryzae TaxID=1387186 RepID=A0A549T7C8_9HYPH|nr:MULTISPECIES: glycosyltransferase family 4 protein [Rhizobium]TRL37772.1 glycosyltransferase family 4 protein [Rhizobium straminoryzae]SIQ93826.1 Glycosyltransferase involved in cell wall bisynthesis [Rhizobium sp. RU35A]